MLDAPLPWDYSRVFISYAGWANIAPIRTLRSKANVSFTLGRRWFLLRTGWSFRFECRPRYVPLVHHNNPFIRHALRQEPRKNLSLTFPGKNGTSTEVTLKLGVESTAALLRTEHY